MSSQGQTVFLTNEEAKTSPAKQKSSQIELSPSSPLIDGLRQSTIAFKVQRIPKADEKATLVTDNENIAPAEFAVSSDVPKGKKNGASHSLKQALPSERLQIDSILQSNAKPTKKPAKSTRTRRPTVRRSISAGGGTSATSVDLTEGTSRNRAQQACSVSPIKLRHAQSSSKRLQQTQLFDYGIRRTARQFANDLKQRKEAEIVAAILKGEESGMKVFKFT
ncbi:unnamed protein product [Hymenolepis diminuta]|uniref:H15 domain-containing protein n=1 Tax=Hymenolepis diminuta TaxID=6216 RepID=A0A0R3SG57_HYMDI|nr:unnamed protein product [Hymenolepis diminuta]